MSERQAISEDLINRQIIVYLKIEVCQSLSNDPVHQVPKILPTFYVNVKQNLSSFQEFLRYSQDYWRWENGEQLSDREFLTAIESGQPLEFGLSIEWKGNDMNELANDVDSSWRIGQSLALQHSYKGVYMLFSAF